MLYSTSWNLSNLYSVENVTFFDAESLLEPVYMQEGRITLASGLTLAGGQKKPGLTSKISPVG